MTNSPASGAGCTLGPAETFGPGDHHLYVDITVMRLESSLFGTFERMGAHHHKEVVALNDVFPVESRIGHFVEVAVEIFKQLREKRMQRFVFGSAASQRIMYHGLCNRLSYANKDRDFR